MSLTALATSFADRYSNARNKEMKLLGALDLPQRSDTAATSESAADHLKALADFIPSELLTLYIAAIAAVTSYAFVGADGRTLEGAALAAAQAPVLKWIFWACLAACPLWECAVVYLAAQSRPPARAFIWPMIAATIAFAAYAMAIPGSWLAAQLHNGYLFGALAVLIVTPVLLLCTKVYTKLFPA